MQTDGYVPMDRMRVLRGPISTNLRLGRVEFNDPTFHNTDIPLVPDKRDAPSWERLRALEVETCALRGEVAILTRKVEDLSAVVLHLMNVDTNKRIVESGMLHLAMGAFSSDADLHDEWR